MLTFLKRDLSDFKMMQDPSTIKMNLERFGGGSLFTEETLEALRVGEEALHLFDVEELDTYLTQAGSKGLRIIFTDLFTYYSAQRRGKNVGWMIHLDVLTELFSCSPLHCRTQRVIGNVLVHHP